MKCIECKSCYKGYFASKPDAYVCIGVKEPFVINNIYRECTEYPEKRSKVTIEDAISHFKYGISHDIFSEPVTTYAKMAVEAMEKQSKSDFLMIGYDYSPEDIACMVVSRGNGKSIGVLKTIFGEDATELYEQLTDDN